MKRITQKLLVLLLGAGFTLVAIPNCSSDESETCGTEDALCTFLLLQSNELLMSLSTSGTVLGGAGEGDTITVNVYPSSDSTCSGTPFKTFSFSLSTLQSSGSYVVPGSSLKGDNYFIRMTRGSTNSNCDSARVNGVASNYYCSLSNSTLSCSG